MLRGPKRTDPSGLPLRRWHPGMACGICGELIRSWQPFNHDHVVPMSKGGPRGRRNKTFAHLLCNCVKGDRHPFSLRTAADREAARTLVTARTYARLQQIWAGR